MKYDFTSHLDRAGKDAIAVDLPTNRVGNYSDMNLREGFDIIPMWVADMNFATCPTIPEAIIGRAQHPAYGYYAVRDEYYDGIIEWQRRQHGVTGLAREHIGYENGVLGGVASALRILCSRGDSILVHSPTYIGFTMVLTNNGYNIVHSPLKKDENGVWRMDYEDMEKKIVDNHIHTAIFCSPHNPCGRVWTREEIEKAMAVYEKHDVYVISDEIWSDLILYDNKHIPTQTVNDWAHEHTIAFYAPSKTFNLAGLIGSYSIVYSKRLRDRLDKEESLCHYNSMNVLSMYALIGAYKEEGYEWLAELKQVLSGNVSFACDYIRDHFEGVTLSRPEGTYMLFLQCEDWLKAHDMDLNTLIHLGWEVGVMWQDGSQFIEPHSIHMNLALPLDRVQEAFARLDKYVFNR